MDADLGSHTLYRIGVGIFTYLPPILLIIGTVGNLISIVVLTRKHMRKSTTSIFLTVLAISDISVLYTGVIYGWPAVVFRFDITQYSDVLCKLKFFSLYFFGDLSGWILVCVTFERVILVWFPQSGNTMCSRRCALVVILVLIIAIFGINAHIFYGLERNEISTGNDTVAVLCGVTDNADYMTFFFTTWPWVDLTVFIIGPFILLVIGNSLIIGRLLYNRKKLQTNVAPMPTGQNQVAKKKKMSQMIPLLFALSAVYVITNTPQCIYSILLEKDLLYSEDVNARATAYLIGIICGMLLIANNTFNFVLYFMSGTKFREEAKSVFCSKFKQENTST